MLHQMPGTMVDSPSFEVVTHVLVETPGGWMICVETSGGAVVMVDVTVLNGVSLVVVGTAEIKGGSDVV